MQAVILAAGRGRRLRPHTDRVPKALLRIGGRPLLEHSLIALAGQGVQEVLLVVGHLGDALRRRIGPRFGGMPVTYLSNPDHARSGSLGSLAVALPRIRADWLLLESDLIYDSRALGLLRASKDPAVGLVTAGRGRGDEVWVRVQDEKVTALGKRLPRTADRFGEWVGLGRFSLAFARDLHATLPAELRRNLPYEPALLGTRFPLRAQFVPDLIWQDIDTPADLLHARRSIWPRIRPIAAGKGRRRAISQEVAPG